MNSTDLIDMTGRTYDDLPRAKAGWPELALGFFFVTTIGAGALGFGRLAAREGSIERRPLCEGRTVRTPRPAPLLNEGLYGAPIEAMSASGLPHGFGEGGGTLFR